MIEKLRQHLNSITPEQFEKEIKDIELEGFDGGVTMGDFVQSINTEPGEYNHKEDLIVTEEFLLSSINNRVIDFINWVAKNDWMSIWVEDKWMWEYQKEVSPYHPYFGYVTGEQLYLLYLTYLIKNG